MVSPENTYAKRKLRSSYVSTIIGITLVLFMIGLLGVIMLHARKLSDYVKENIQLSVILKDDVKEADIEQLQKNMDATPYVKSTEYVPREVAAARLQKDLGEDFISFLGYNPLLASIDIKLKAGYANADSLNWIEKEIMENKPVKEIFYQRSLVDLINENLRTIGLVLLVFSGLLTLVAIALINNTIRLSLYSKRFLIKTMQLVGATQGFIRWPFVFKGMLNGMYAALIANLLLAGIMYLSQQKIPELFAVQDIQLFGTLFLAVIFAGIMISCVSTFFAVRKYLKMKLENLYY